MWYTALGIVENLSEMEVWTSHTQNNAATSSNEIQRPDMEITKSVPLPEYNLQKQSLRKHFTLEKLEGKLSIYSKKS